MKNGFAETKKSSAISKGETFASSEYIAIGEKCFSFDICEKVHKHWKTSMIITFVYYNVVPVL